MTENLSVLLLEKLCQARQEAFTLFRAGILDEMAYLRLMAPLDLAVEKLEWATLPRCNIPSQKAASPA